MNKRKMGLLIGMCLVLLLLAQISVVACAGPASSPVPTSTPAATPAQSATEVIQLIFSSAALPASPKGEALNQWVSRLNAETGGKIKVVAYLSGSLTKANETFAATEKGTCDMGETTLSQDASRFPLGMVSDLPFIYKDSNTSTIIANELFNTVPAAAEEFKNVEVLFQWLGVANFLHTTKKSVRVPTDVTGMKIIATAVRAQYFQAIGASPISQLQADWYTSLNSGLTEGICAGWVPISAWSLIPLVNYHMYADEGNFGMTHNVVYMNKNKWNSLPQDLQKKMKTLGQEMVQNVLKLEAAQAEKSFNECKQLGHSFVKLTPQELQYWSDAAKPLYEKWIADKESKGLRGKEVYDTVKQLVQKYTK